MIRPSITVSLFPASPNMPFVLGPDLESSVATAAELGYRAVELFPPNAAAIDSALIKRLCDQHEVKLSTIGTGGGWFGEKLSFTDPDSSVRDRAMKYARQIIELAGDLGGAAIVGSMQGKCGSQDHEHCLKLLGGALSQLGEYAQKWKQPLFYEPLNRYETDLVNNLADGAELLQTLENSNVKLLADLFHMNIEEADIAIALKAAGRHVQHVHFVDSNRWPPGFGHTNFAPIVAALNEIGFDGYVAMEVFPRPSQHVAAQACIDAFEKWFGSKDKRVKKLAEEPDHSEQ